jgi:hypothetical protein
VIDDIDPFEDPPQIFLNQVEVAKRERSRRAGGGEVLLFKGLGVILPETIDADDIVAVGKQPIAKMRTDESRRSGDNSANWVPCLAFFDAEMTRGRFAYAVWFWRERQALR